MTDNTTSKSANDTTITGHLKPDDCLRQQRLLAGQTKSRDNGEEEDISVIGSFDENGQYYVRGQVLRKGMEDKMEINDPDEELLFGDEEVDGSSGNDSNGISEKKSHSHPSLHPANMPPPKSILKHPNEARISDRGGHLKWDEDNLMLNEAQKSATMKIDEPPTPYVRYDPSNDTDASMDDFRLSDGYSSGGGGGPGSNTSNGSRPPSSSSATSSPKRVLVVPGDGHKELSGDWDDSSDEEADPEAAARHSKFKDMRDRHYSGEATRALSRSNYLLNETLYRDESSSSTGSDDGDCEDNSDNLVENDSDDVAKADNIHSPRDEDEEVFGMDVEEETPSTDTDNNMTNTPQPHPTSSYLRNLVSEDTSASKRKAEIERMTKQFGNPKGPVSALKERASGTPRAMGRGGARTGYEKETSAPPAINSQTVARTQHPSSLNPSKSFVDTYGSEDN
ncbi:hypothetical protein H4219_003408 [Mycoemilia scoparia]|uniref:Uncharacterized protein n=1 Tax=Mycoemilia scoparia TaxID=417184 RepID=A0A9W8A0K5_9FUNG|nr:hypothetical protein H4219_003408 [Mycoemilia scoparia]